MRRVGDRRSTWIEKLPVRRRMEAARDKERAKKGLAEPAECGLIQSVPIGVRFFSRVPHPHLLGVLGRDVLCSAATRRRRWTRSGIALPKQADDKVGGVDEEAGHVDETHQQFEQCKHWTGDL